MALKASAKENGCARVFAANPPRVRRATRAGRCHRHPCKREARHALYPLFSMAVCQTLFDIVMAAMRERCDERSKTFVVAQALPFWRTGGRSDGVRRPALHGSRQCLLRADSRLQVQIGLGFNRFWEACGSIITALGIPRNPGGLYT